MPFDANLRSMPSGASASGRSALPGPALPGLPSSGSALKASDLPDLSAAWTAALRGALHRIHDRTARTDLLFLERWEMAPQPGTALALRVQQIRRANPELAAAIRAEVAALRSSPTLRG